MTAEEKEAYLAEWEWQKGLLDWELVSSRRVAYDLNNWLKCVKKFVSERNYNLLLDVFKSVFPLYFDSYDEIYNLSPLTNLIWATLELPGFVLERQHIVSIREKLELLLEEDTLKAIEISHDKGKCASDEDWEEITYYLTELLEFTQKCDDKNVAIIYII